MGRIEMVSELTYHSTSGVRFPSAPPPKKLSLREFFILKYYYDTYNRRDEAMPRLYNNLTI